jgi:hypothetical protein
MAYYKAKLKSSGDRAFPCFRPSLTNSNLLTADIILLCTKKTVLIHDSHSPFRRKMYILPQIWSHRPSIRLPAIPLNVTYLASSVETVIRELALYKLLKFQNPNLMSIFRRLGRLSKESVQVRGSVWLFVTNLFVYGGGLLAPRSTHQAGGPPLSSVRGCLFDVFAATLHSWRPFLYPQPEDASCSGDREST